MCLPMPSPGRPRPRGTVSLQRAVSKLRLASRRDAGDLIRAGRITVRGTVVLDPARAVRPELDDICVDGSAASFSERIVIACHKPRGVVVTNTDPQGRPTIFERLADPPEGLMTVGRLDLATSGLLLLTNDSRLADWLTDPANSLPRTYLVTVRGRVEAEVAARWMEGIVDRGETLRASAAEVRKASGRESHLLIELREGKNREVRRMCAALGHPVTRLRRVAFAGIQLGDLAPGEWRTVEGSELPRGAPPPRG